MVFLHVFLPFITFNKSIILRSFGQIRACVCTDLQCEMYLLLCIAEKIYLEYMAIWRDCELFSHRKDGSVVNVTEKAMAPTPVLVPGKSHGWRGLVGCGPWGR